MSLHFQFFGNQIDGARDYQEDAYLITHLAEADNTPSMLLVVADGMGGHAAGNVASNMAVQTFNQHVSNKYPEMSANVVLKESVQKANNSISETIKETDALRGMGCTLVGLIVEQKGMWWVSVGDSHLYLIRRSKLIKKNEDHSYGGFLDRMKKAGKKVEMQPGMRRNMLMSGVTGDEIIEIDCPDEPAPLEVDDRLIICSDGMDTLDMGKMLELSKQSKTPKEMVTNMLQAVTDAGKPRQDNTTALVIDVSEPTAATEAEPPPTQKTVIQSKQMMTKAELQAALAKQIRKEQQRAIKGAGSRSSSSMPIIALAAIIVLLGGGLALVSNPKWIPKELAFITRYVIPTVEDDAIPAPKEYIPPPSARVDTLSTVKTDITRQIKSLRDPLPEGGTGPDMVIIPAITRIMGDINYVGNTSELPQHEVAISAFAIGRYEVTVDEYNQYAPEDQKIEAAGRLPVTGITKRQAMDYTRWLSTQTGKKYRLATEAEWEHAAAATAGTAYWWGPKMKPKRAHCLFGCDSPFKTPRPVEVGQFLANPFGLHDTSGNVAEMVADCWHPNYVDAPVDGSAWVIAGDCSKVVIRGGSYETPEKELRNSSRSYQIAKRGYPSVGFRIARDVAADELPPAPAAVAPP